MRHPGRGRSRDRQVGNQAAAGAPARAWTSWRRRPTGSRRSSRRSSARPDLCILDVGMPRMTGLQAAREIRSHLKDVRVLMLSMHDDEHYLFEALKAGASGYVLKREADQDLVGAVRAVGRGEAFLTNAAERSIIRAGWRAAPAARRSR